ncbi:hypothetical protein SKAU_G00061460 [Synaphobranchus kaupii]|uniref:Uncharacterized protein n=1 Tax=Synaphobranchus kaupii TaxID=118154 RepID=A0A9Q1G5H2_SYNKA|nr:hypothetical protein SKAU_G00061460 [Synaphobranchus kaupii]
MANPKPVRLLVTVSEDSSYRVELTTVPDTVEELIEQMIGLRLAKPIQAIQNVLIQMTQSQQQQLIRGIQNRAMAKGVPHPNLLL